MLSDEGNISNCITNDRRDKARYQVENLDMDVDDVISGAMYVPIKTAMKFVKTEASPDSRFKRYSKQDSSYHKNKFYLILPEYFVLCKKNWTDM